MTSVTKFDDIFTEKYSEKSVVVRGDTRKYKEDLKKLGGKYNGRLRGGPGWIFSSKESSIIEFIENGKRLVTDAEAKEGERKTNNRGEFKQTYTSRSTRVKIDPTLSEYTTLVNMMIELTKKVDKIGNILKESGLNSGDGNIEIVIESEDDERPVKRLLH
jgi:hypothetical protein